MNKDLLKQLLENISAADLLKILDDHFGDDGQDDEGEIIIKKRKYNGRTNWTETEKAFVKLWFWSMDEDFPRRSKRPKGAELARFLGRPYESIKTFLNRYEKGMNEDDEELNEFVECAEESE